jgi:hypothetical protein
MNIEGATAAVKSLAGKVGQGAVQAGQWIGRNVKVLGHKAIDAGSIVGTKAKEIAVFLKTWFVSFVSKTGQFLKIGANYGAKQALVAKDFVILNKTAFKHGAIGFAIALAGVGLFTIAKNALKKAPEAAPVGA